MSYIKHRIPLFLMYICSVSVMLAIAYLGGQDTGLFFYSALIITFFLICIIFADARSYYKRRRLIKQLSQSLGAVADTPVSVIDPIEKDWHALALSLTEENAHLRELADKKLSDSSEYYTLWVHQIKIPIAAMRLVLEGKDEPVLKQELFKIERYAELALKYVKLGSIASDVIIEECGLGAIVSACVKKFALLFVYGGVRVDIRIGDATVLSDKKWLCFIIEQILSNAVKYTQSGGLVTISSEENTLVISDTGSGIRPEDLPRIFEKGYTGLNGRIDGRASGIGLYLTKKAADALSIKIDVFSQPGEGTEFRLSFPERDIFFASE